MEDESPNTLQFPDARRFSRVLSPRTPTQGNRDLLLPSNYTVDEHGFQRAFKAAGEKPNALENSWLSYLSLERLSCDPLASFLNECVAQGDQALKAVGLRGQWYDNQLFIYDKDPKDGTVKPNVCEGNGFWHPLAEGSERFQIRLPVEVKNNWAQVIEQATIHARCLLSANPSRTFAPVLAFNQHSQELKFLIFHRGGLISHVSCNLAEPLGRT
ncbi:hypothetical protein B0H17DRAFT_1088177 [Mycena rosella]|uniref:Uncharacterized protein n=1 Tax=Mycena rosella TaxID=1033263 RepID=A0AAD7CXD0_MYCRO|nr:hypothetical protein B0H17DRAFT_1088177 [Mycena rosella]